MLQNYCVLDFEVGQDTYKYPQSVISIGIVKIRSHQVVDSYYSLIKSNYCIDNKVKRLTHLDDKQIQRQGKSFVQVNQDVKQFVQSNIIFAHGALINDRRFYFASCHYYHTIPIQNKWYCSQKMARQFQQKHSKDHKKLKNVSAYAIGKYFNLHNKHPHCAISDAFFQYKFIEKMSGNFSDMEISQLQV